MAQYVYATTIFEIKRQAMADSMHVRDLPKTTDMRDSRV